MGKRALNGHLYVYNELFSWCMNTSPEIKMGRLLPERLLRIGADRRTYIVLTMDLEILFISHECQAD